MEPILLFEQDTAFAQQLIDSLNSRFQIKHITGELDATHLHNYRLLLVGLPAPDFFIHDLPDNSPTVIYLVQDASEIADLPECEWYTRSETGTRIFTKVLEQYIQNQYIYRSLETTQKQLEASRYQFRSIINKNSDGIILIDRKGLVRFVNPAAEKIFNRAAETLLYTPFGFPLITGETSELDIARNQDTAIVEMRVVETEWEGEPASLASLRDITERKASEEHLRLLVSAIEQSNDAIIITTIKNGERDPHITFVNPAFTYISGYTPEEVIEQPVSILQPGRGTEAIEHLYQDPIANQSLRRETMTFRKNQETYYVDWQIVPIHDENEQIRYFLSIQRDITEHHHAQEALRKSEETFRALFEAASEGILITDVEGTITHVNRHIEILFGYDADEIIGQPIEFLIPKRFRENHVHLRDQYLQNAESRQMGTNLTLYGRRKDSTEFAADISLSYVEADEPMIMAFIQDITERLRMQQEALETELLRVELAKEREIHELKNRFISTITHEFRTPLAVIQTASDLLRLHYEKLSDTNREKYLSRIRVYIDHLNEMIDDVLTLNKAQMGRINARPIIFNVKKFCEEIADIFDLGKASNPHNFNLEVDYLAEDIRLDRELLYHILTNLISNAIKYSPDGGSIHLRVRNAPPYHIFEIQDEGIGIPADEHLRIFEAFHRAHNTGDIEGTGLGLAIVKNYVEVQNGRIDVISNENEGTTMQVYLPILPES